MAGLTQLSPTRCDLHEEKKGLQECIEPKNLIKELGGEDDWTHGYEEPMSGENEKLTDHGCP